MPTVQYITDTDRAAGWGSTGPPPKEWIGQEVKTGRPLRNWHAYWVEHDGVKSVMSHAELFDGTDEQCNCGDCKGVRQLKEEGQCL